MIFKNIHKQSFRCFGSSVFYSDIKIKHKAVKIFVLAAVIILICMWYKYDIGCVWQRIFGIPCPGCGMTRAYVSLLHGDIKKAFEYNFMFPFVPVLCIYVFFDGRIFRSKTVDNIIISCIFAGFAFRFGLVMLHFV